jgi:hypothetical protein
VLAAQQDMPGVRLVGGAGLAMILGHRNSEDVDLFCGSNDEIALIVSRLEVAAVEEGATLVSARTAPSFRRFEVGAGNDLVRVDVAVDSAPLLDPECPVKDGIRVLSLRDQRANKIVTLLGRSELRDLVDLYFLEQGGWPMLEGLDDALTKDAGVDFAWLAWAMLQIEVRPLPGLTSAIGLDELQEFRDRVAASLLDMAGAMPNQT